ncbi:hypothetical protein IGB42_03890 [Andreprevotia sp. IGB-42]|uniref:protein-tyrosine phosphatase family protein n=1 Tax=Andreprevotia sp. IGB-42 TaxID=2497473 RepID=UPI001357D973|nr:protein-tyrosine phosphatase family protein [Andreprevotia sp. IGB-42]KAF0811601.1 hypothetical protein IGB42_03890 [Andreprevotia sp. IGB-42]
MKRPNPDCYWVEPGRLLAGEYPRNADDASSQAKLQAYLDAGVSCFIDLTEEGELAPYAQMLHAAVSSRPLTHHRFAIKDKSVPNGREQMQAILATIHRALLHGQIVYVHCWGGIGRTGTVIACHLIEQGMSPQQALAALDTAGRGCKRNAMAIDQPTRRDSACKDRLARW